MSHASRGLSERCDPDRSKLCPHICHKVRDFLFVGIKALRSIERLSSEL